MQIYVRKCARVSDSHDPPHYAINQEDAGQDELFKKTVENREHAFMRLLSDMTTSNHAH